MGKSLTLEYVKQYFKDHECELLEEEYKKTITPMKYKCNCGNISKISFRKFQQGQRCKKCSGSEKLTLEYVKQYFKYDYVNSILKKAIEYNGSSFHPQAHQNNDETGWFVFDDKKTVKEARNYEKIKYDSLEKQGYKILTVWDNELHKDFDALVKKCLYFLNI